MMRGPLARACLRPVTARSTGLTMIKPVALRPMFSATTRQVRAQHPREGGPHSPTPTSTRRRCRRRNT